MAKSPSRKESIRWTHRSAVNLLTEGDPREVIIQRARQLVIRALDEGWTGPPFDLAALCRQQGIELQARDDVRDARILPAASRRYRIEFNPNRPRGRQRYSLAHELAHTLFEDCSEQIRHRGGNGAAKDEWQLEMLCNLGAAEILMPFGSLPSFQEAPTIDALLELRAKFDVSVEAILIRAAQVCSAPMAMFSASPRSTANTEAGYRIDYFSGSPSWPSPSLRGQILDESSIIAECNAVGHTAKGSAEWGGSRVQIECVGLPPFPGYLSPRVAGILSMSRMRRDDALTFVQGDATTPARRGTKIIVHLVNDATPNWGGNFARQLKDQFPLAQEDFRLWATTRTNLRLGQIRWFAANPSTTIATVIGQRGYGPSPTPRVRYQAIHQALTSLADHVHELQLDADTVSLHMPRIGAGEAGGAWPVIEDIIRSTLCHAGLRVTVYDRPGTRGSTPKQSSLPFGRQN